MEYKIEYKAYNHYEEPVKEAIFEFNILPCSDEHQVLLDYKVENSLKKESFYYKNLFGFEMIRVRATETFNDLYFSLWARVEKADFQLVLPSEPIKEELEILNSLDFKLANHIFLHSSELTALPETNVDIPRKETMEPVGHFLMRLNSFVYKLMTYTKDVTHVHTTALDVYEDKQGVCQDYAHLFIAIARINHIPTRYVSGYLRQTGNLVGSMLMHAWVEALVPGHGWYGLDPTNHKLVDEQFIKVSHGVDYTDCAPLKGVLLTNGKNVTSYEVKVLEEGQAQQ